MKVLVTGSHGYIGSILVPMLLGEGYEVLGLDSNLYENCVFGDATPDMPELKKDIRDVELSDLRGVDAVIHLAALSNDPLSDLNPELTFEINYKASVRLARLAKQSGISRFIFSSSCSTYGASGDEMLTETALFPPRHPLRRIEGLRRKGRRGACGFDIQSHLSAKRDRLRRLLQNALRSGIE